MRRALRFVVRPAVVAPLLVVLIAVSVGAVAMRDRGQVSAPSITPPPPRSPFAIQPTFDVDRFADAPPPSPTPTPTPAVKPKPKPKPNPPPAPPAPSLVAFRDLGAWVDLYDEELDPETAVADMAAHGVKTLYMQTARWNRPAPDDAGNFESIPTVQRWLHAAHAKGMKVVGWYLPAYDDLSRDVRRTKAIATYRSNEGQRFDALGIDIEYKSQVSTLAAWNVQVAEHARRVRAALGPSYPIAAIVPAPLAMEVRPTSWEGFPWRELAASSNVFMPMAYWSFRHDCPEVPEHCASGYTKGNVEKVRALTGKPNVPVHVIGGVGDEITVQEVADFVSAALAVNSYGGSLYDYDTTEPAYWPHLAKLND